MPGPLDTAITSFLTLAPDGEVNQFDHLTFVVGSQEMFDDGLDDCAQVYGDEHAESEPFDE